ncbi:MAG: hypothetical protein QXV17_12990 [Candidatus Micrarchaeaceae archaeon]
MDDGEIEAILELIADESYSLIQTTMDKAVLDGLITPKQANDLYRLFLQQIRHRIENKRLLLGVEE